MMAFKEEFINVLDVIGNVDTCPLRAALCPMCMQEQATSLDARKLRKHYIKLLVRCLTIILYW